MDREAIGDGEVTGVEAAGEAGEVAPDEVTLNKRTTVDRYVSCLFMSVRRHTKAKHTIEVHVQHLSEHGFDI